MTQTNNEREALIKDAVESGFHSDGNSIKIHKFQYLGISNTDILSKLEKFVKLQLARAQSPISQNEQQPSAYMIVNKHGTPITWSQFKEPLEVDMQNWYQGKEYSIQPLFTSPPKQAIPDGWKPTEKEILKYASEEELFLFADESDLLEIANGILELVQIKINAAPTNTEVRE